MTNKEQPTPEERERHREYALMNLEDSGFEDLRYLAVADRVESEDQYGPSSKGVSHQNLYLPSVTSGDVNFYSPDGNERNVLGMAFADAVAKSEGRYSESITGRDVLKASSRVIQNSLTYVKVGDIVRLIGSGVDLGEINDEYVYEVLRSGSEEEKKQIQKLIGAYMKHSDSKGLSKAYDRQASAISGGLEQILKPKEE